MRPPAPAPPDVHDASRRIEMTASCHDCDDIPKVPGAGEVLEVDGTRLQRMHNGVLVVAGAYHGDWMTEVIRRLHGHHEPQEERVFHAFVERLARDTPRPVMVELGSFWGYYSLWLRTAVPGAVSHLVEPDPNNLEVGRRHFRINGLPATFHQYAAGGRTHPPEPFRCESDGVERQVPAITVEELMRREGLERVDLLLADIQGPELQMLEGAAGPIREGRLRFLVLSTHHMSITGDPLTHQRCRAMVEALGGHVVTEHSVSESYSGDGLIAASFDPRDRDMHVHVSANRARDSLFGEPEFEVAARDAEIARLRGVLRDH